MLSIICPIYNEEKYIKQCIESIIAQDYPKNDLEVLFVDGMSTDKSREIVAQYSEQYSFIHLLDNPNKIVPYAMNIGIEASKGNIIIRLDAHTYYQNDYFSVLTRRLVELKADNIGTVCKTDVLNKTPKTLAIREVLSNKFGVGNSIFRTGLFGIKDVDTVPFGCWKREVFDNYGLFDVRLVRNQDIELNKRIRRNGGKILLISESFCTYFVRETFTALAKNNYGNGKWNILTVFYTGELRSLSLRHFVPLLFVLGLFFPCVVGIFWHSAFVISLFVVGMYFLLIGSVSVYLAISNYLNVCYLLFSFLVLHVSYGFGSFAALLKLPFIKK